MRFAPVLFLALAWCLLPGCASPQKQHKKRAEAYVNAHPELDQATRDRILAGEVVPGMTADQVVAAVGGPGHIQRMAGGTEHWEYASVVLTFKDGLLVSWVNKSVLY
jgi:outer membrane protein assembly factor BamE (lipoprotein component of BamABCDE complex)